LEARRPKRGVVDESTSLLPDALPAPSAPAETITDVRSPIGDALPFAPTSSRSAGPASAAAFTPPPDELDLDDQETTTFSASSLIAAAELLTTADIMLDADSEVLEAEELLDAPPSGTATSLDLEHHARLCAEIALDGSPTAALARYGVSTESKASADAYWRDAFLQNPGLRAAWNEAFDRYRAWYASKPR
jgi:hypothetical protein